LLAEHLQASARAEYQERDDYHCAKIATKPSAERLKPHMLMSSLVGSFMTQLSIV
jgi:hypothetical protein